jgi:hypothetical protein
MTSRQQAELEEVHEIKVAGSIVSRQKTHQGIQLMTPTTLSLISPAQK